ncbi:MAG: guanine nucleotide-binding protein subunit alpha [Shewanella sp.]|nr:guanine nucleotide-binding protein subunit alpha [Shewanella sp.]
MKLNTQLYDKLRGGLSLTSPASGAIAQASGELSSVQGQLSALPGGIGDSYAAKLASAQSRVSDINQHIEGQKSNLLTQMNQSVLVNRVDAALGQVPSPCMNMLAGTGLLSGDFNDRFAGLTEQAGAMAQALADYAAGVIDLTQLQGLLDEATALVDGLSDSLNQALANELAHLQELKQKIQAMSLTQALESLWNDPCVQGVLDQTLPDDIKGLLP